MVDGLRAHSLGAYGNTWYPTPALDRFASGGMIYDRCLAESIDLGNAYDALWTGRHALNRASAASTHLIDLLATEGYLCHLVTDDAQIASRSDVEHFGEVTLLDTSAAARAAEVSDTSIGRALEAAANVLGGWSSEYEQPRLLWVHMQGLLAAWDAPAELAKGLVDEDDPELAPSLEVPEQAIAAGDAGVDETFLAACRYAGQVMALDQCLGAIDELLVELWPDQTPTVLLGGTRGFALGEHGQLGIDGTAYRELFHLPLLVRGSTLPAMVRSSAFTQTSDVYSMLLALAAGDPPPETAAAIAAGKSADSRYVETNDWQLVVQIEGTNAGELYVAPDDQWQTNDVASLCPSELQQLTELAREIARRAAAGESWRNLGLGSEQPN